jgi:hypothetical protein
MSQVYVRCLRSRCVFERLNYTFFYGDAIILLRYINLNAHLHRDSRMALVSFNDKVFILKLFYILHISCPAQCREWLRLSLQLHFERVDVVPVHMCVTQLNDQFSRVCARDKRDHVCEESIRRDVERDTKPQVGRALEHEA